MNRILITIRFIHFNRFISTTWVVLLTTVKCLNLLSTFAFPLNVGWMDIIFICFYDLTFMSNFLADHFFFSFRSIDVLSQE